MAAEMWWGTDFFPFTSTSGGHSQRAISEAGTQAWALESDPGQVVFILVPPHGWDAQSSEPHHLFYKIRMISIQFSQNGWEKEIRISSVKAWHRAWNIAHIKTKCWQLLTLGKRGLELEVALDSARSWSLLRLLAKIKCKRLSQLSNALHFPAKGKLKA